MRLISFLRKRASDPALGALVENEVVDLAAASTALAPGLDAGGMLRSLDALLDLSDLLRQ